MMMSRTKTTTEPKVEPVKRESHGIPITIEVSHNLYAQIKSAANLCGYTPEEWVLFEAIMEKI